jgi:hypothetical protein
VQHLAINYVHFGQTAYLALLSKSHAKTSVQLYQQYSLSLSLSAKIAIFRKKISRKLKTGHKGLCAVMCPASRVNNYLFATKPNYLSTKVAPATPGFFSARFNTIFSVSRLISSIFLNLIQLIPLLSLPSSFLNFSTSDLSSTIAHT